MHLKNINYSGTQISQAKKAIILLHGRGASALDIMSITGYLHLTDFAIIAPQATNNSWYPYSFLFPPQKNEPWLTSALNLINELVKDLNQYIETKRIYILGFSQGACLSLEFAARNAQKYGGIIAFSGGLIGDKIYSENYKGNFNKTPVFIGSSFDDQHIPAERVTETSDVFKIMNADVILKLYSDMGHTIIQDEINTVNSLILEKIHV